MNEETLFHLALEKPPHERAAFLEAACAGDADMRARVQVLLQANESAGSFLQKPIDEQMATSAFQPEAPPASHRTEHSGTGTPVAGKSDATHAETTDAGGDELTFLAPSTKPGCLGRLGHYEIQEVIGKGGFGTVLKAFDEKLHRIVAIKVLSPAYAAIGSARKRFIREAQSAAAVKNEHVVAIYSVQDEAQPPYLVMELVDGISLQDKLDKKGPLGLKEILRIGLQTAEGLAAAHKQGLVHRDIKPANILLENGVERVKITDFGLARAVDDASLTQSGTVAGTPMYMSPEQAEGVAIDHRSDLFSLGTVLYAMCTGHPPFRASGTHAVLKRVIDAAPRPIREINNEIPDWLCAIIAKLHAKKPEERFQTAHDVAELLGQHLAHLQQPSQVALPPRVLVPASKEKGSYTPLPARVWWGAGLFAFGAELSLLGMALQEVEWSVRTILLMGHALFACVMLALFGLVFVLQRSARPRGALRLAQATILCGMVSGACMAALAWIALTGRDPPAPDHSVTLTVLNNGDPDLDIEVNGRPNAKKAIGAHVYHGAPGAWEIRGFKNGRLIRREVLTLKSGEERHLAWNANDDFFTPLFNGKDLTGWKTHPDQPGIWRVAEGLLVGRYDRDGYLFSERGDYEDFHLRAEVKINENGNSGLLFRCESGFSLDLGKAGGRIPIGYEVDVNRVLAQKARTGTLWRSGEPVQIITNSPVSADTWFTLEVVAQGNRVQIKVNGQEVVDYLDQRISPLRKGHLALQITWPETSNVHFRKIEIKELPPSPSLDDQAHLQGDWVAESGEVAGKQLPPEKVKSTLRFQGNKMSMTWPGGKDDDLTFELDVTADPKKIDVISPNKRDLGIYRFDGDRLVLGIGDNNERPAAFTTKAGANRQVIVFRRASVK